MTQHKSSVRRENVIEFHLRISRREFEIVDAELVELVGQDDDLGYREIRTLGRERVLIEAPPSPTPKSAAPGPKEVDSGLNQNGFFLEFAKLKDAFSEDAVLDFARRYGLLGGPCARTVRVGKRIAKGEPVSLWHHEVDDLSRAVALWRQVGQDHPAGPEAVANVKAHLRVKRHRQLDGDLLELGMAPRDGAAKPLIAGPVGDIERVAASDEEVFVAARLWVEWEINNRINSGVTAMMVRGPSLKTFGGLRLVPDSLLSLIWVQFAQAVSGNTTYRACDSCGWFFEVSLEGRRADSKYCSDACRSKAYRERKPNRPRTRKRED